MVREQLRSTINSANKIKHKLANRTRTSNLQRDQSPMRKHKWKRQKTREKKCQGETEGEKERRTREKERIFEQNKWARILIQMFSPVVTWTGSIHFNDSF